MRRLPSPHLLTLLFLMLLVACIPSIGKFNTQTEPVFISPEPTQEDYPIVEPAPTRIEILLAK